SAVTKAGSAQKLANAQSKGATGAINQLVSSVQTLAINFGTILLPTVTSVSKALTTATGRLDKHKTLTEILVGAIAGLAAALIAVVILLYTHWKPFRDVVNSVWDSLRGFASWVKGVFSQSITTTFHQIVAWLKSHWQDVIVFIIGGPFLLLAKKAADAFGLTG